MRAYLTQDLFFSGHTATTFLLVLYAWRSPRLRARRDRRARSSSSRPCSSPTCTTRSTSSGAYAVTFAIFALREGWPAREWRRGRPGERAHVPTSSSTTPVVIAGR